MEVGETAAAAEAVDPSVSEPAPSRRRWKLWTVVELALLVLAVHLLIPQFAGLKDTANELARATWWLPVAVLALEGLSLLAYGELVLVGFRKEGPHVSRNLVQRVVVVGNSLGRSLPAGNAASFTVVIGAFRRAGVNGVTAGVVMASSGLLSSAVLAALLPLGVLTMLTTGRLTGIAVSAAVAAAVVLLIAMLVPFAARNPEALGARVERMLRFVLRGPVSKILRPEAIGGMVERGAGGVRDLATDRRALMTAGGWAAANWLLDAAVVAVLALTVGEGVPLAAVLLAYLVAQLTAALPLTPGGVGIVEPAMIGVLVSAGSPASAATVTVLGWRLISHWLPILVGLALLPTLRYGLPAPQDD